MVVTSGCALVIATGCGCASKPSYEVSGYGNGQSHLTLFCSLVFGQLELGIQPVFLPKQVHRDFSLFPVVNCPVCFQFPAGKWCDSPIT